MSKVDSETARIADAVEAVLRYRKQRDAGNGEGDPQTLGGRPLRTHSSVAEIERRG
jgi:hypothetical protein